MSPYYNWSNRIIPLFTNEVFGFAKQIAELQPTWLEIVCWIGEKVGRFNLSYMSCLCLGEFSSQITDSDTPYTVVMKLYKISHHIPASIMSPSALVMTVKPIFIAFFPAFTIVWSLYIHQKNTILTFG